MRSVRSSPTKFGQVVHPWNGFIEISCDNTRCHIRSHAECMFAIFVRVGVWDCRRTTIRSRSQPDSKVSWTQYRDHFVRPARRVYFAEVVSKVLETSTGSLSGGLIQRDDKAPASLQSNSATRSTLCWLTAEVIEDIEGTCIDAMTSVR
jgi:hypothetical protein